MSDVIIRKEGQAGRITLNRPQALNALTWDMCTAIETAITDWAGDDAVTLVIIDAAGNRAFCSGGDIAQLYEVSRGGDLDYGRRFWTDEYRLNAKLAMYPKPIVTFLQGFTMGGGVGLGCHASHRVVGDTSQIAMPEVSIGLVPDVGGSMLLAQAPGRMGEYLALMAARMDAGNAIYCGFADHYAPEAEWPDLITALCKDADTDVLNGAEIEASFAGQRAEIEELFKGQTPADTARFLEHSEGDFAAKCLKTLSSHAPLAMHCAVEMIRRQQSNQDITRALELEYRYTYRAVEQGDFLEGIRAAIIDKDRRPNWAHSLQKVPAVDVSAMLRPLGKDGLNLEDPQEAKGTSMKIGFIGLGNMGAPMAANLVAAGHEVTGFDLVAHPDGLPLASSAAEAAQGADVVITMLPNGDILQSVANDILPAMAQGAVLLDCSTVDVDSARAVAAQAQAVGCGSLDAPVSGGIGGAQAGTLTFMVGGSQDAFAKTKPLFDIMGQKAVHCGAAGNGQAAKICNNMILGITMIGTCEAFALADKLGLDRQAMFDVVSTSSGYSWSMNAYCPAPGVGPQSPADNDYTPGFAAALMLKDLRLSQQAAEGADADTPLGHAATDLYAQFAEAEGQGHKDFSAMLPRFEKRGRG